MTEILIKNEMTLKCAKNGLHLISILQANEMSGLV